jgi:uncharacterized RmlC-like cupin family protein
MNNQTFSSAVGTDILFENERVRVWELALEPGAQCEFHQHHHDHVIIYPQAGNMRGQEFGEPNWGIVSEAQPGFVLYRAVGPVPLRPHRLKNLSDVPVVHYIIELLDESASLQTQQWEYNDRGRFHNGAESP